jgi:hypothetical protein
VKFEVHTAVLLKIPVFWDVTLRGDAVQIILGLLDPEDKDTMTCRGHAVQIVLELLDPADKDTMSCRGQAVQITLCKFAVVSFTESKICLLGKICNAEHQRSI